MFAVAFMLVYAWDRSLERKIKKAKFPKNEDENKDKKTIDLT